jgi:type I restriction enzyme S subunit
MTNTPPRWVLTSIGEIAELVNGRSFKPSDWGTTGLPIVRIQNLNRSDSAFNHFSGHVDHRHIVETGDLLFAWSGTPGTSFGAHIWEGPQAVLNQHIFNVRVDPQLIDLEFLKAAINQTLDRQIAKAHGGAGLRHITKDVFEETPITLPPLLEQRRIVEHIKRVEHRIASAAANLELALVAVDRARSMLLSSAYDLSLVPTSLLDYNERDRTPRVSVGEISVDMTYGSSTKSDPDGPVVVLRMGNIQGGELDWTELVFTSDEREIVRYKLEPGDVLFNRTNSPQLVGKTAVFNGERPAIHAGYLIRVRCSSRMIPDYLAYCLNSPAGREYCLSVKSDGVSQSNINARKLAAFELPCPSREIQRTIVNLVQAGMRRLAVTEAETLRVRQALAQLSRQLLSRAVVGEAGTGRSGDGSASLELDRLIADKQLPKTRITRVLTGVVNMKRSVAQILQEAAGEPMPAQRIADLYGIRVGATPEEIEPFYAELRALDQKGLLVRQPIKSASGTKLGERISLKSAA